MTYESKELIIILLENNGYYPGDPQMSSIWSYMNETTCKNLFAVFADESHNDIYISPYVIDPILLWRKASPGYSGLTKAGERFLNEEKK